MARKTITPAVERTQLATFSLNWDQKLRIPISLVTQLLEIFSQCMVVQEKYMDGNCYCYFEAGELAIQMNSHSAACVYAADEEEAKLFVEYHNNTRKLLGSASSGPVCTIEEFRAAAPKKD